MKVVLGGTERKVTTTNEAENRERERERERESGVYKSFFFVSITSPFCFSGKPQKAKQSTQSTDTSIAKMISQSHGSLTSCNIYKRKPFINTTGRCC